MSPKRNHPKTTDELLRALPKSVPFNGTSLGKRYETLLMVIPDNDGEKWTARYFSLRLKIMHGTIPMTRGKSVNSVLKKMHDYFKKNIPESLNKKWEK